jgi:hypothetical protein
MNNNLLKIYCTFFILLISHSYNIAQQSNFCGTKNTSTKNGEELTYKVYYTLAGAYIGAGEAVFSNKLETYQNKPIWHVTGFGKTYRSYDWFYKVRDTYESYIDTTSMLPLKFVRNVSEANNKIYNHVNFNHDQKNAVSTNGVFKIPECTQDVLSTIYYARNIDFNQYHPGDKIPVTLFLDDEVHTIYIRYLGKEKLTTNYGTYQTIKFRPLLIEGTLFKGGEKMEVWVTDDKNKLPVLINTPILVGSIKVYLVGAKNLRNSIK